MCLFAKNVLLLKCKWAATLTVSPSDTRAGGSHGPLPAIRCVQRHICSVHHHRYRYPDACGTGTSSTSLLAVFFVFPFLFLPDSQSAEPGNNSLS